MYNFVHLRQLKNRKTKRERPSGRNYSCEIDILQKQIITLF